MNKYTFSIFRIRTAGAASRRRGFTLFIAIVTAAIVIAIALALLDVTRKQVKLAGIAYQSEIAFQAANAGLECVRFYDVSQSHGGRFDVPSDGSTGALASPECFGNEPDEKGGTAKSGSAQWYEWTWADGTRCTDVSVYKFYDASDPEPVVIDGRTVRSDCPAGVECTVIKARGYNGACNAVGVEGSIERELTAVY
jgi:hypothetical protein